MISHRLSAAADESAVRYDQLTASWQALFSRALTSETFFVADQIGKITAEAYTIADSFFDLEKEHIGTALYDFAIEAHQSVLAKIDSIASKELTDAALTHLRSTQLYLSDEIIAQIHRDIAMLRQALQQALLEISMVSRTRGIPNRKAMIEYRIVHGEALNFTFRDRLSRATPSRTYIRALWRQTLLAAYNEIVMMDLADHGFTKAAVKKIENGVETEVDWISLDGQEEARDYGSLRNTYFHPNSNAWLDKETSDV